MAVTRLFAKILIATHLKLLQDDLIWEQAAMDGWLYLDVRDVNNIQEVTYTPPVPLTNSSTRSVQKDLKYIE